MRHSRLLTAIALAGTTMVTTGRASALESELIWAAIERARGAPGQVEPEHVSEREQLLARALRMIRASNAAYELTDATRARAARRAQYQVREFISTPGDTQVLLLEDEHTFVVAVRGTQKSELRDWALDLAQASVIGVPGIKVHVGFHTAALSVFDRVNDLASGARLRGKEVILTGHSLGGAVAQLLAFMLLEQGIDVADVHTFGSPAIGTHAFAQEYDARLRLQTHRWVNEYDPIPCYPALQQAWEQTGRQHLLSATDIELDSDATICEDAFPSVTTVCEGGDWWGEALRWVTGIAGICESSEPAIGLVNLVENLMSNEASQHESERYETLIAAQAP